MTSCCCVLQVPLSGYGGISKLILENVQRSKSSIYWTTLQVPPRPDAPAEVMATVRNVGDRAAYAKCVAFKDHACKEQFESTRVSVQPEEFCLRAGATRNIRVVLRPSKQQVADCADSPAILASLAFFYGDEVTRQQLRKFTSVHFLPSPVTVVQSTYCRVLLQIGSEVGHELLESAAQLHNCEGSGLPRSVRR